MRSEEKSIYDLKLGESLRLLTDDVFVNVLRVPGGWVYISQPGKDDGISSVFVPYNNELELAK